MILPKIKLKNQLALVNALSKVLIIVMFIFAIPWIASRITMNDTDNDLVSKLDDMLFLVDSLGIDTFFDEEADFKAFGSYNILKEEYISIEHIESDTIINSIAYSQRIIEDEMVDYRVLSYSFELDSEYYLIEIGKSITTILRFEKQLKRYAIILMIIILIITIVIEVSLIQYMLKPIDLIVSKLKSTSHPSSFNFSKIKTNTSDFLYLEKAIHNLMYKIEESFNNEREYISNVSHELLTPISIIKSKLDNIIMEDNLTDNDMVKVYESKKTLGRLTQMIRTLLMLSRIENEEYLLKDNIDVIQTLKNVVSELEDRIQSKELELILNWNIQHIVIKGNNELLFNMFYNLINNAIKYTQSGFIKIESFTENQIIKINIIDSGDGIDVNDIPYIFTRFSKFKTNKDSFGLGLALAKKICNYHNIDIDVSSKLGEGTKFCLTLKTD